jgi:VanZ family protein
LAYYCEKPALKKNTFSLFLPAILWVIISTILLTLPGSAFPTKNWLAKIWFDKWVHIGLFTILVILFCRAVNKSKKRRNLSRDYMIVTIAAILYGITMEFVQKYWIINRSFDGGDIIADIAGSFAGLWFSYRYIKK